MYVYIYIYNYLAHIFSVRHKNVEKNEQRNKFQQMLNSKQTVKNAGKNRLLVILPNKINPTRLLMRRMQRAK